MNTYERNEETLHIAPTGILIMSMLSWFIVIALLIIGAVLILSDGMLACIKALAIPFIIILIYGIFSEVYFTYEEGLIIKIINNVVNIEYALNQSMMPTGNNKVTIRIKHIEKIEGNRVLTIYGDITKKSPLGKVTQLKKYKIKAYQFKEGQELIKELKGMVQSNKKIKE